MSQSSFRFDAKKYFLTYSDLTIPGNQPNIFEWNREHQDTFLTNQFNQLASRTGVPDVTWAVISLEKHETGTPHVHVAVEFSSKLRSRDPTLLDGLFGGTHPNIQPIRNIYATLKYIIKDGIFVELGIDVAEFLKGKNKKGDSIAKRIMEGESLVSIAQDEPGYVSLHINSLRDFAAMIETDRILGSVDLQEVPNVFLVNGGNPEACYLLGQWLNDNLLDHNRSCRRIRQKQLWLYGTTGTGKNRMVGYLESFLKVFWVCTDEDFWDGYDDSYDLIVIDEFAGQKKIQVMNQFVAGTPYMLKCKRQRPYRKRKNPPVIILSNMSIESVYHRTERNSASLDALMSRFESIYFDSEFFVNNFGRDPEPAIEFPDLFEEFPISP